MKTRRTIKFLMAPAVAGSLLLSACGYAPNTQTGSAVGHNKANGKATVMLMPSITAGSFRTQALVNNYTKASINHLVVKVFRLNGVIEEVLLDDNGNQVSADLTNAELDNPVTFANLFRRTIYRIKCYAYKAPGENPSDLISTQDFQSYTDVVVDDDDRPTVGNLKVRLIDVVFDGEANTPSGVEVTDGGFISSGPVTIGKATPTPTPAPTAAPQPAPVYTVSSNSSFDWMQYEAVVDVTWNREEDGTVDQYELELYRQGQYSEGSNPVPDAVMTVPVGGGTYHSSSFRWTDYSLYGPPSGGHVRVYAVLNGVRSVVAYANY